jgi:hypothetical protein
MSDLGSLTTPRTFLKVGPQNTSIRNRSNSRIPPGFIPPTLPRGLDRSRAGARRIADLKSEVFGV